MAADPRRRYLLTVTTLWLKEQQLVQIGSNVPIVRTVNMVIHL